MSTAAYEITANGFYFPAAMLWEAMSVEEIRLICQRLKDELRDAEMAVLEKRQELDQCEREVVMKVLIYNVCAEKSGALQRDLSPEQLAKLTEALPHMPADSGA